MLLCQNTLLRRHMVLRAGFVLDTMPWPDGKEEEPND